MSKKVRNTDGGTEVRCLMDSAAGKCNDVVVLGDEDLVLHLAAGNVDPDEAAVKYAKTLKQNGGDE